MPLVYGRQFSCTHRIVLEQPGDTLEICAECFNEHPKLRITYFEILHISKEDALELKLGDFGDWVIVDNTFRETFTGVSSVWLRSLKSDLIVSTLVQLRGNY